MNNQLYQYICTSLPHGLKFKHSERNQIYTFTGIKKDNLGVDSEFDGKLIWWSFKEKPILRPLDLTKEITHKGETFVPEDKLAIHLFDEETRNIILNGDSDGIPYWVILKLIEWHFDVGGWIESKEAIDVNTLKVNCYE